MKENTYILVWRPEKKSFGKKCIEFYYFFVISKLLYQIVTCRAKIQMSTKMMFPKEDVFLVPNTIKQRNATALSIYI